MSGRRLPRLLSVTLLTVLLTDPGLWHLFSYDGIRPNQVSFSQAGMRIEVDASNSPTVVALERTAHVKSVAVAGQLKGEALRLSGGRQGESGFDDFALRIGLVVPGTRRLDFLERQFAPDWVVQLSDLAPEGLGLDQVYFLNAVADPRLLGRTRTHPASDLLVEHFAWELAAPGAFSLAHEFDAAIPINAIWIAADGDDTQSTFTLDLERLEIGVE